MESLGSKAGTRVQRQESRLAQRARGGPWVDNLGQHVANGWTHEELLGR